MIKALITAGATRENIDGVRFITNLSTGGTGAELADALAARGWRVTALCAASALKPLDKRTELAEFSDFRDLDSGLRTLLRGGGFDAVIHLAAVGDYSVAGIEAGGRRIGGAARGKISSDLPELTVRLKKNFKILDRIKTYAEAGGGKPPFLVGFKLTAGASRAEAEKAVRKLSAADLVVHNDTRKMRKAHVFNVYKDGRRAAACTGAGALAAILKEEIYAACS